MTMIVVTHEMGFAREVADTRRVHGRRRRGRVRQAGRGARQSAPRAHAGVPVEGALKPGTGGGRSPPLHGRLDVQAPQAGDSIGLRRLSRGARPGARARSAGRRGRSRRARARGCSYTEPGSSSTPASRAIASHQRCTSSTPATRGKPIGPASGRTPREQSRERRARNSSSERQVGEHELAVARHQLARRGAAPGRRAVRSGRCSRSSCRASVLRCARSSAVSRAGQPAETQARQAVRLGHGAERQRVLVGVARGGQAPRRVVLEAAVDLVAEQRRPTRSRASSITLRRTSCGPSACRSGCAER